MSEKRSWAVAFVRRFPDGKQRIGMRFWADHGDELTLNTFDNTAGPSPHHAFDLTHAEEEVLYRFLRKRRRVRRAAFSSLI
jgi:hypothetical protein